MISRFGTILAAMWLAVLGGTGTARGQIDPEERRLIQLGYNQHLEGRGPIAGYGFYYYNQPNFFRTNVTLRLAVAPIYVDSDFGFSQVFGPNTDLSIGMAGGGFADSYSEVRRGKYLRDESFLGHGAEISANLYHRLNPDQLVPLWAVLRMSSHWTFFESDSGTSDLFELPDNQATYGVRAGLRLGGQEPSLTAPLAMELSVWSESRFRTDASDYGFDGDRAVADRSHLFWGRALMKYVSGESEHSLEGSITAGTSIDADRFNAYRLGGVLPFASEFPLNIPGYYFQELTAEKFVLANAQYSFPLTPSKNLRLSLFAASGVVEYLEGMSQPGKWHTGAGGGLTYISPSGAWFVTLMYGHGFDAIRDHDRGANQVGILFQYDFDAKKRGRSRFFYPEVSPYRSRGGERLFR